LYGWWWRWW